VIERLGEKARKESSMTPKLPIGFSEGVVNKDEEERLRIEKEGEKRSFIL
jgi:hypothetical protein